MSAGGVIINEAGLFARAEPTPLVALQDCDKMQRYMTSRRNVFSEIQTKEVLGIIDDVRTLPTVKFQGYYRVSTSPGTCATVVNFRGFAALAYGTTWERDTLPVSRFGLDVCKRIARSKALLINVAAATGLQADQTWNISAVTKAVKLADNIANGVWTVRDNDPVADMAQADAFAVYLAGKKGFLTKQRIAGPLGGAVLYESAQAAVKSAKATAGVDDFVVVAVNARATRVVDVSNSWTATDDLKGAISLNERDALVASLAQLDARDLLKRIALLEDAVRAQGGVVPQPVERGQDKPAPRKKM